MTTSLDVTSEALAKIAEQYEMTEPERVRGWLVQYPFLVPILRDMRPEIQARFPDARVRLAVTDDPEEDYTELLAWIDTRDGDVENRRDREEELHELLWQDNERVTQDKLAFILGS